MNQAISLLPGADSIKQVYSRTLKSKQVDFICLSTNYEAVIGPWYDQEYSPQLFGGQIITREVVVDTPENRVYGTKKDQVKNLVRYLSASAESDLVLGDDFVAILSFNPSNPYAVVLEDPTIVNSVKAWFEAIWISSTR